MGRFQRSDYRWLLLADPPVCRAGRPAVVLNNCGRLRRNETCWCRFETQEAIEHAAGFEVTRPVPMNAILRDRLLSA